MKKNLIYIITIAVVVALIHKNYEQSQFQELGEDNPILKSKNNLESKKNQENDKQYYFQQQ